MAMMGQRRDLVLVPGACVLSHRESKLFPMCVEQERQNSASIRVSRGHLGPGIKAQSLCFSLQSLSSVGTSRLRTDRGIFGLLTPWQSTQSEPHLRTSQQPFNTGKVSKKTHRVAHGGPLNRMRSTAPWGGGSWVVMSLGELRCSQVSTRPGGAIQGHRGNMVILHNLKYHPLKTKAECRAKWVGVVWGGRPVQDNRFFHRVAQELLDVVPLAVGCACFCLTVCIFFLYG